MSEFHRYGDGHQPWCKSCRKIYDAAYTQRTLVKKVARQREKGAAAVAWNHELKSSIPCADCGGSFHPVAMQWDHLPGQAKRGEVGVLVRSLSRNRILEEIAKCQLVCANCHAVRTYERRMATKNGV